MRSTLEELNNAIEAIKAIDKDIAILDDKDISDDQARKLVKYYLSYEIYKLLFLPRSEVINKLKTRVIEIKAYHQKTVKEHKDLLERLTSALK